MVPSLDLIWIPLPRTHLHKQTFIITPFLQLLEILKEQVLLPFIITQKFSINLLPLISQGKHTQMRDFKQYILPFPPAYPPWAVCTCRQALSS